MATATDKTSIRIITEDGELVHDQVGQVGFTSYDFECFANKYVSDGETAQWYVYPEGDLLAEQGNSGEMTTYPAASLFD